uniref:NADH-ubiquinone oxidoreductase chain 5 n=1 Tax=Laevapex fuscus TaxID=240816 RepID=A0A8F8AIU4_9GAST|nr:NADH dehydrogenase subunit 5 [Laevapex fuscus]
MKNKKMISVLLFSLSFLFFFEFFLLIYLKKSLIIEFSILSSITNFNFSFIFDNISLMFGVIVSLISGSVFMFSCKYMEEDKYFYRFLWILLSFVISMLFLIYSGSLFFMLLGWDGLGITSFALIIYYQSKESFIAGFQTLMINRLGDALIVSSVSLFIFLGQFSIYEKMFLSSTFFLVIAALTKSAQFPFSSWLPAAMAAPTPVSALVHSSTLVTAGIYLIIRLSIFCLDQFLTNLLLFLGAITCLLGGAAAMFEYDLKKLIALSTLSQLGLMVFCLGMGYMNLSLFHLFSHALFKAMLFLAAGSVLLASWGNQDLRILGGIVRSIPFSTMIFNLSLLCLMGIPFLSAFFSKHSILEKVIMSNMSFFSFIIIIIATVFTTAYSVRMMKILCWSSPMIVLFNKSNEMEVNFPMIILGLFSVIYGKFLIMVDNFYLEYISSTFSLNFIILMGLIIGMVFTFSNSFLFSTMFFLTPMYNNMGQLLNPFIKKMKYLDGWMEIGPLMNISMSKFMNFLVLMFNWPKVNMIRVLILMFLLLIVTNM